MLFDVFPSTLKHRYLMLTLPQHARPRFKSAQHSSQQRPSKPPKCDLLFFSPGALVIIHHTNRSVDQGSFEGRIDKSMHGKVVVRFPPEPSGSPIPPFLSTDFLS